MIPPTVERLLQTDAAEAAKQLLADTKNVFAVDWREEDDAIVGYCESVLRTGDLSAEITEIDDDPGFELWISHAGRRIKAPLVAGPEDRHITLYTLNQLLKPHFEIRLCADSLRGFQGLGHAGVSSAAGGGLGESGGAIRDKSDQAVSQDRSPA
jgi:hypothetical protein